MHRRWRHSLCAERRTSQVSRPPILARGIRWKLLINQCFALFSSSATIWGQQFGPIGCPSVQPFADALWTGLTEKLAHFEKHTLTRSNVPGTKCNQYKVLQRFNDHLPLCNAIDIENFL